MDDADLQQSYALVEMVVGTGLMKKHVRFVVRFVLYFKLHAYLTLHFSGCPKPDSINNFIEGNDISV